MAGMDVASLGINIDLTSLETYLKYANEAVRVSKDLQGATQRMGIGTKATNAASLSTETAVLREQLQVQRELDRFMKSNASIIARNQRTAATAAIKAENAALREQAIIQKELDRFSIRNARIMADTAGINQLNGSFSQLGMTTRALSRQHMVNLGYQFQDIAVGIASSQKPLTILIQQGSQIMGTMMQANVGIGVLIKSIGRLLLPLAPLAAGIGAAALALNSLKSSINDAANMDHYINSLGLAEDQLESLTKALEATGGAQVAFRDIFAGFAKASGLSMDIGATAQEVKKAGIGLIGTLKGVTINAAADVVAFFKTINDTSSKGYRDFVETLRQNNNNIKSNATNNLVNMQLAAIEQAQQRINKEARTIFNESYAKMMNQIYDDLREPAEKIEATYREMMAATFNNAIINNISLQNAAIKENIAWIEKWRTAKLAELETNKKDDVEIDKRSNYLDKVRLQLQNEMMRIELLREERDIRQQIDRINENLTGRGLDPLNVKETAEIEQQIRLNQQLRTESERIFDLYKNSGTKALQDYEDQLVALTGAMEKTYLTQFEGKTIFAQMQLEAMQLAATMGEISPFESWVSGMYFFASEFQSVARSTQQISTQFFTSFYTGISDALAQTIISSKDFEESIYRLGETILTQLVSSIIQMGIQWTLAQALGSSFFASQVAGIGTVQAASTAATQVQVAQNAEIAASAAPAAVAQAGASWGTSAVVAAGAIGLLLGLIPAFTGGFAKGGYTGNGSVGDIAGVVHGQEFVMNAGATARNRAALEAMNAGKPFNQTINNANPGLKTIMVQPVINVSGTGDNQLAAAVAGGVREAVNQSMLQIQKDFATNGTLRRSIQ